MSTQDERHRNESTNTICPYVFMRRRGAWASPNAPSSQDDRKYKGKHEHTHKRSYAFMKRRGAWARPKRSLVTRRSNVQGRRTRKTQDTRTMLVRLYEEERCMGKPERSLLTRRPNVQGKTRTHTQTVERTRETQEQRRRKKTRTILVKERNVFDHTTKYPL